MKAISTYKISVDFWQSLVDSIDGYITWGFYNGHGAAVLISNVMDPLMELNEKKL